MLRGIYRLQENQSVQRLERCDYRKRVKMIIHHLKKKLLSLQIKTYYGNIFTATCDHNDMHPHRFSAHPKRTFTRIYKEADMRRRPTNEGR